LRGGLANNTARQRFVIGIHTGYADMEKNFGAVLAESLSAATQRRNCDAGI